MAEGKVFEEPATGRVLDDSQLMFAFAHDLRGYLRTILTRIQLVQSSGSRLLPEEDLSLLEEAVVAARDINGLLLAMTAYCDIPAGGAEDVRLLLRGLLIECKASLVASGAEIEVVNDLDTSVPSGLKKVLKELLMNACRFRSGARPLRIVIATRIAPTALEVSVTDNGIGVDPGSLEKIFAPFQRLHSRDEFPGYGLGLATCRRTVAAWGGTIAAELPPQQGLTVRVTVPMS